MSDDQFPNQPQDPNQPQQPYPPQDPGQYQQPQQPYPPQDPGQYQQQYQQPYPPQDPGQYQQQYQQPYPPQYPQYGPPQMTPNPPGNGMAIASLVLGIVSIVFCWLPLISFIFIITAIIGVVLGVMARKKNAEVGAPTGMATAGLVISIIALVFSGLYVVCSLALCGGTGACSFCSNAALYSALR